MFGGLSMTEILIVLVIALIIFGPRKLPELGKSIGQSLAQFRRASEDFKRSWEAEVTMEEKRAETASANLTSSLPPPEEEPPKGPDGDSSQPTV